MKHGVWLIIALFCLTGCSLFEPTTKVDTDGDGTPDREMTADQAVAWGKTQEARKREEAEQAKQKAKAQLRRVERDFQATIDDVAVTSQKEVNRLKGKLDDSIAAIGEDLDSTLAMKKIEFENVGQTVNTALSEIERKETFVSGVAGLVSNPTVQGLAGLVPGGALGLSLIGNVVLPLLANKSGRKTGETIGVAKGRDVGWDEHAEHQKTTVDATWDAGQLQQLQMLMAAGVIKAPTQT